MPGVAGAKFEFPKYRNPDFCLNARLPKQRYEQLTAHFDEPRDFASGDLRSAVLASKLKQSCAPVNTDRQKLSII